MNRRQPLAIRPVPVAARHSRAGTSLVEVLMSLLVMGVGVVAVATLFPASVLRSVQATQLTNATVLRLNAEAALDLDHRLILDPDTNGTNYDEVRNDYVGPPAPPPYPLVRNYVIDPYGYKLLDLDGAGNKDRLGANNPNIMERMPRYAAGRNGGTTDAAAVTYVTQPDSWIAEYDTVDFVPATTVQTNNPAINPAPQNARTSSITIRTADVNDRRIDLANLQARIQGGEPFRVILFDAEGRASESRNLTFVAADDPIDVANNEIKWTASPLPDDSRYNTVSRVRIERFERRYSWLMTVHRPASAPSGSPVTAEINVAVIFRRSISPREELAYQVSVVPATANSSRPEYSVTKFDPADPEPFVKKGGFLLDPVNARWYRIAGVNGSASSPRIRLDRNPSKSEALTCGIFLRGVVDVYPFTKQVTAP